MGDRDGAGGRAGGGAAKRRRRVRAYVGLGANLGDASGTIAAGVRALGALPRVRLASVSPLYATAPVGGVAQPDFRNAVVALDVTFAGSPASGALSLLVALKDLERAFGRRDRERWGPRELDLDILVFGRASLSLERPPAGMSLEAPVDAGRAARLLQVPHPEAGRRLFVLAPLADIAPGLVPPGWRETVASAARGRLAVEGRDAARRIGTWDEAAGAWRLDEMAQASPR